MSQKDIVFRKIAKPLIKRPFRGVKGRNGGSHKFRHIRDMSDTPSYGIDVLSNPKYPYFDNSNTSKQEFCYIPKDNIFLGHPVEAMIGSAPEYYEVETVCSTLVPCLMSQSAGKYRQTTNIQMLH